MMDLAFVSREMQRSQEKEKKSQGACLCVRGGRDDYLLLYVVDISNANMVRWIGLMRIDYE